MSTIKAIFRYCRTLFAETEHTPDNPASLTSENHRQQRGAAGNDACAEPERQTARVQLPVRVAVANEHKISQPVQVSACAHVEWCGAELWHGTRYGMSVAEVSAVVPEATVVTTGDDLEDALELLRIDSFELNRENFTAHFYFADGRLVQVTLRWRGRSLPAANLVYNSLMTGLRAKYGYELASDGYSDGPGLVTRSTEWLQGRTNINLFLLDFVGSSSREQSSPTLNINYQLRIAPDADKL